MIRSLVIILFLSLFCRAKVFRFDYEYNEAAEGWLKYHIVPGTWREARLRCHAEGAVLASPLTEQLKNAIINIVRKKSCSSKIFTGVHATFSKGDYTSIEGIPLTRLSITWAYGEPDNHDNTESCLAMLVDDIGSTSDVRCDIVLPYVCYKKYVQLQLTDCGTTDPAFPVYRRLLSIQNRLSGWRTLPCMPAWAIWNLNTFTLKPIASIIHINLLAYHLEPRTGSCYKFHRRGLVWSQAFMTCLAEGAHLAIINNEVEQEVVRDIYQNNSDDTIHATIPWALGIGFHDWGEHMTYLTIHGETLDDAGFQKWAPNQPDNATRPRSNDEGEFCASVFRNAFLNDLWCNVPAPFLCEKSVDSLFENIFK